MSEARRPQMRGGVHLCDFNQRMSRASCRNGSLYCASVAKRDLPGLIPKRYHPMERCVGGTFHVYTLRIACAQSVARVVFGPTCADCSP